MRRPYSILDNGFIKCFGYGFVQFNVIRGNSGTVTDVLDDRQPGLMYLFTKESESVKSLWKFLREQRCTHSHPYCVPRRPRYHQNCPSTFSPIGCLPTASSTVDHICPMFLERKFTDQRKRMDQGCLDEYRNVRITTGQLQRFEQ